MPPEKGFHGSGSAPAIDPSTTRKIYVLNGVEARATQDGRVFYVDHNRKSLSWNKHDHNGKVLTLPSGWEARATDDGRVYYVDHNDQSSSWIRPLPNGEKYALPEGWPSSETASELADPLEELELEITRCRLNLWLDWRGLKDCLCKKYALQHQVTKLDEQIADDLAHLNSFPISGSTLGAYAWRLNCLASSFIERWQAWKSPKDYQRSFFFRRLSLAICPLRYGHLRTITKLQMALSMLGRSAETTNIGMLDQACTQAEAALNMDGHDQSARPEQIHIVAYIFRQRYLLLRNLDDLDRSIELSSRASEFDIDDTGPYGDYENLSFSLWLRYDNTRGRDDLERAIAVYIEGVQCHVYKAEAYGRRVKMLTALLSRRYELLSNTSDLKKAVSFLRTAISSLSITSPKLADLCSDAVSFLLSCSEVDSKITYFQEAMTFARMGLQQKNMNVDRAFQLLVGVGKVWSQRFTQNGDLSDQQNALHYFEEALSISGNDGPSRTTAWHFISLTYENTYVMTNNQEYLQLALQSSARGLETASNEDTWYMYARAARSQAMKYQGNNEDLAALSEAIFFSEKALQAVKECDLHDRAKAWQSAGQIYYLKFKRSRDAEDFTTALTLLLLCWRTKEASFVERVACVKLAGALLANVGRWRCAWEHLSDAVQFVSTNFPPHLNRMETLELAKALSGLASEACAAGLTIGETAAALEHLEQGRGLLISSTYGASGEISNLQVDHPPLYDAFMKLRKLALEEAELDPNATLLPGGFLESEMQRGVAFEYLKKGVHTIRKQRGYERFLMPLRASEMQKLAGDGAIVVINNTTSRNDAILVTRDEIKALRLPDLPEVPVWNTKLEVISGPVMDEVAHKTLDDGSLSKKSQNGMLGLILEHLWQLVVCPVLDALQYTKERMKSSLFPGCVEKCRIWWMVTGNLSRLPLHAAGMWFQRPCDSIFGRAISSYVTTFRMLAYTRQRMGRKRVTKATGLFVSMARPEPEPNSKLHKKRMFLKSAEDEEQRVRTANPAVEWTSLTRKSAAELLKEIPKHSLFHIATHGISDPKDPSQSHLVLMRLQNSTEASGQPVPVPDKLTVADMSHHDGVAENAVLAFLTACSTADSRAQKLGDEGLQISNAFHLAGFPHVIGSLWPANELICPEFAENFYGTLKELSPGDGIPSSERIALAYYMAWTKILASNLEEYRWLPLLWAGFVHTGP